MNSLLKTKQINTFNSHKIDESLPSKLSEQAKLVVTLNNFKHYMVSGVFMSKPDMLIFAVCVKIQTVLYTFAPVFLFSKNLKQLLNSLYTEYHSYYNPMCKTLQLVEKFKAFLGLPSCSC